MSIDIKEKKQKILDFINDEEYIPMTIKEMAQILEVPKSEHYNFVEVIKILEDEYLITKNRRNKIKKTEEKYIPGKYRKNQKGFGFVTTEKFEEDIYIPKNAANNALNGDTVLVEIEKQSNNNKKIEGKIVKILVHEKDEVVGVYEKSKNFGFVVPDDKSFGTDIFISKKDSGEARNRDKVIVKITRFPERGKKAEGKVIEILGNVDETGVDMISLIKEHSLPSEFPEQVVEEARKYGNKINESEIYGRVDFRDRLIFTIDGEDAKDLDDAIRVEKINSNRYKLEVHIADVSHYVKEGSLLDKEASIRGTSVYMLGKVIPMLPKELSNELCSLNAKQDRFTLSCLMEIDGDGNLISSEVVKGIINVEERMSYNDVQKIIDNSDTQVVEKYSKYINEFKLMEELAIILKNKRLKEGYLNLDIPESKLILDDNGKIIEIKRYESTFANEIIEQFMLKANEAVAEKFYWLEAPFIYRVHEDPDVDKIKELNKFLINYKLKVKVKDENVYPKEFAKVLTEIKGKEEEKVVSTLILRTLKLARYEAENKGHFGIASKYYSHFTSPIRRYPDLFIHRVISKYISENYVVDDKWVEKHIKIAEESANQSTEREKIATKVERESVDMKKAEYMENKKGMEFEGIVSSVTSFGMFVELPNTIEGLIRFEDMGNEYFEFIEERRQLVGENTGTTFKLGDKVKIKVKNASKVLRQIDFYLVK